jgi:hypothetical protein
VATMKRTPEEFFIVSMENPPPYGSIFGLK